MSAIYMHMYVHMIIPLYGVVTVCVTSQLVCDYVLLLFLSQVVQCPLYIVDSIIHGN